MSRLQAIENSLSSINQAAFQNLCDSFLALRNSNYSVFSRLGTQSGKQKTVKGTPDTFLLLPNGKYIFVEYSTNITAGLSKLEQDIIKCIDTAKTGIPINQIAEIILCINFNLTTSETQKLIDLLANTWISLTVYTLDYLAIELHLNHRDLAHEYLGLALDTGQIVSIERFVEEYNKASKGISTPLNNAFLHREKELMSLGDTILQNDFIILTGAPGIGKTKFALEGIKKFLRENLSFTAYCVSYKHHPLLQDLNQYFDSEKDYILFVDDANRIDAFNQITGFYKSIRKGKLKVLITVRDYAYQDIGRICQEFLPKRIDLEKFSDGQIIDIIKGKPFDIINQEYHREIIRIADGNPRLAIMTALLAKAKQNIYALHDVSGLFEHYFSTFIKDDGEFAKELNIRCLGLIAFFYTIPYKDKETTKEILNNFEIDYSEFLDVIDKLDKLELVEIQFEHVKIPEQNLSTYFFYKAFIKDNLLSFEVLLSKYFEQNAFRFRDCIIPANNTFGFKNVMQKLQPSLQKYWRSIELNKQQAFKFLSTFWYYLQTETLEFIFNIIEALPIATVTKYEVAYANNAFSDAKNEIIELLDGFLRFPNNLKDALGLGFEYIKRKPECLPEWIHKIREQLTYDREDAGFGFTRQSILFQVLIDGLNDDDLLFTTAFYALSQTFLGYKFHHTKSGRNHTIYWYDYFLPKTAAIQKLREQIWVAIKNNFQKNPDLALDLLVSYSEISRNATKEIIEFDIEFIIEIIENNLTSTSFEHCKFVQNQIRFCTKNSVCHPAFETLAQRYTNPIYEMFLKIDWDRFRDKESYDFDNYQDYENLKEADIRNSFVFKDVTTAREFYAIFTYLKRSAKNQWNYNNTLDYVIDENCSRNFDIGCQLLNEVIEQGNEVDYIPRLVLKNHLKTNVSASYIWNILQRITFKHKEMWEFAFYDYLDDSLLSKKYVDSLVNTVAHMRSPNTVHFDRLKRFLPLEQNLFQILLQIIVEKNEKEQTRLQVWVDLFSTHFDLLGNDIEVIEKAYIQQDQIHNHFDYDGRGFLNILKKNPYFLLKYVSSLYTVERYSLSSDHKNFSFVWHVDGIEKVINDVFDLVISKEPYFGILDHFCNAFFINIQGDYKDRAKKFLLNYCKENFADSEKMNAIVDIARNSMRDTFEEVLLLYLSLNQDKDLFRRISWRGNGGTYSGDVIIGDIEASEWQNILSIVNKSNAGLKLIQIKKYINEQIENSLRSGDWERQRRFLERNW